MYFVTYEATVLQVILRVPSGRQDRIILWLWTWNQLHRDTTTPVFPCSSCGSMYYN